MYFKKPLIVWLTLLCLTGLFLLFKATGISYKDEEKFRELVESSPKKQRKDRIRQKQELTQQTRWNVTKTIYIAEKPLKRQVELKAKRSKVVVISKRPHMQVSETFFDVNGIAQQELYYRLKDGSEVLYNEQGNLITRTGKPLDPYIDKTSLEPTQRFRYFEADRAVYDFQSHQLIAHNVHFWTYTTSGHDVVLDRALLDPEATGKASRMVLYLNASDAKKSFSADNLSFEFTTERGL